MTEQEKREKAIEEMSVDLQDACDKNNNYFDCSIYSSCYKCQAEYLVDKCHYRKEEEVRKETAEVFSNRIKSLILEFYGAKDFEDLVHKGCYGIIHYDCILKELKRLEKEFCVEESDND